MAIRSRVVFVICIITALSGCCRSHRYGVHEEWQLPVSGGIECVELLLHAIRHENSSLIASLIGNDSKALFDLLLDREGAKAQFATFPVFDPGWEAVKYRIVVGKELRGLVAEVDGEGTQIRFRDLFTYTRHIHPSPRHIFPIVKERTVCLRVQADGPDGSLCVRIGSEEAFVHLTLAAECLSRDVTEQFVSEFCGDVA